MLFVKIDELHLKTFILKEKQVKNLTNIEETKQYMQEYLLYRKLFTEYIIEILDLKKYEEKIMNSDLNIKAIECEEMDFYQLFSSDILKFFYIRNDIYVEKLNDNERNFLKTRLLENKFELDDKAKSFIETTYKVVITDEYELPSTIIYYGPNTIKYSAVSNALVLGMRYDEFSVDGLDDSAWKYRYEEQFKFLYSLFDRMEVILSDIIEIPVNVIKYNEYSVVKYIQAKEENNYEEEI